MGGPALIDGQHVEGTDNFLVAPFMLDEIRWFTCEQYFQWAKFSKATDENSEAHCEAIKQCADASRSWQLGQSRRATLRPDWESVKANVMYRAVQAKFAQHPVLAAELAATKGAIRAAPSTADWQHVNSVILDRVRDECRPPEQRMNTKRYAALVALTEEVPATLELPTTNVSSNVESAAEAAGM